MRERPVSEKSDASFCQCVFDLLLHIDHQHSYFFTVFVNFDSRSLHAMLEAHQPTVCDVSDIDVIPPRRRPITMKSFRYSVIDFCVKCTWVVWTGGRPTGLIYWRYWRTRYRQLWLNYLTRDLTYCENNDRWRHNTALYNTPLHKSVIVTLSFFTSACLGHAFSTRRTLSRVTKLVTVRLKRRAALIQ